MCLYTMDFVSAGKNTLLLYATVCEKVVPRLNKHDAVIEWNFMKIAPPPKWRAGCALLCDVTLCNNQCEILIGFPLLSNVRHRAMMMPVFPPLTRLILISPSCSTIYRIFKIILEMVTVYMIELQTQCSTQVHCFRKHSVRYELCFKKYLTVWELSDSNGWAWVKREWKKSRERLLRTILFYSGHLQHERERPDMERKYMNSDKVQRKEPELTT